MYYNYTVTVPKEHIVKIKKEDVLYIYYECGRSYDKDKKYTSPKRMCIGKMCSDDEKRMHPNQNFYRAFPDSDERPELSSQERRSSTLGIGPYVVIKKIISSLGIDGIIRGMNKASDSGLFLDLIAYTIITEDNAAQYYPDYAYHHALFTEGMKIFSDSKISSFLSDLGEEAAFTFLRMWNKKMDHREKIYISYDATNKNTQAGELSIGEFGEAKDKKNLPIFNYAIAYDKTNSKPLFYERYCGSIVDVSQLQFMIAKAKAYGYRSVSFILDRGYFSEGNLRLLDREGYAFIIMLKGRRKVLEKAVDETKGSFETKSSCYIKSYKVYGTTIKGKIFDEDDCIRYIHVYYSITRAAQAQRMVEDKFNRMSEAIEKQIGQKYEFNGTFNDLYNFTYDKDGTLLFYEEKPGVREKELKYCGYIVIVTSEAMEAPEALNRYKSRDDSEKLFRGDKSYLGNSALRTYTDEKTDAKILIEFVALIVRSRIYTNISQATFNLPNKPNYATVPAVMKELDKIEITKHFDNIYRLDHPVTKKQKDILSYFGISEDDIKTESETLGEILRNKEA